MKLAICLSGHFRTYAMDKDGLGNTRLSPHQSWLDALYSKYDCDVFLHTWDIDGRRVNYKKNDEEAEEDQTPIAYTEEELEKTFGFKKAVIESYSGTLGMFKEASSRARETRNSQPINMRSRRITHIYSLLYKVQKCMDLVPTDVHYDAVIRSRPDMIIRPEISLNGLDFESVVVPWYNEKDEPHDYFMIANPQVMRVASDLYSHMDYMLDTLKIEDFLNAHKLLYHYLSYRKVNMVKMIDTFELLR